MLVSEQVPWEVDSKDLLPVSVYSATDPTDKTIDIGLLEAGATDVVWLAGADWATGQTWESKDVPLNAAAMLGPGTPFEVQRGRTYQVKARYTDGDRRPVVTAYEIFGV